MHSTLKKILIGILFSINASFAKAQQAINHVQSDYSVNTKKTISPIKVDGLLNELIWQQLQPATNFWMKFPVNDMRATLNTEVRITYDEKNIYFGIQCFDSTGEYSVQSLKRDKGLRTGDGVSLMLDPYNQKSNGFFFAVNAYNSQSDDLLTESGELTFSWDNKWFSQTKIYDDKWVAEIAIPFNILRFDPLKTTWGINFIRNNRKQNQFFTWTKMPLQFRGTDLGYFGLLHWDAAPPKTGTNISFNPYLSGNLQTDKQNNLPIKTAGNAGFDAKIAVTNSLNLDVTVNPDFSQVDVDRQVTNLTRFNLFFPERRGFFLENDDLFSSFGAPPIRPFYTRRIGSSGNINVPILAGARLSGNLNKNIRIGLLNMQTGKKQNEPAENFTAITFNRRLFNRSGVSGYILNKQSFLSAAQKNTNPLEAYGRNGGLQFNYTDKKGAWTAFYGHHFSIKPTIKNRNQYINTGGGYNGQRISSFIAFDVVGTNYYTDMGFVQRINNYDALRDTTIRRGFKSIFNENRYNIFFPKNKLLNKLSFQMSNFVVYTQENNFNERNNENAVALDFKNSATVSIGYNNYNVQLLYPTKFVKDATATPLESKHYWYHKYIIKGATDNRKSFSIAGSIQWGTFYSGHIEEYGLLLNVRKQPKLNLGIDIQYNRIQFPTVYGNAKFILLAPNVEYNFSTKLFWTTFLQYNSQNNNFNVNSRIQWRYRPMSDLFVVYTDNYFTDPLLKNKNRALVFKLNYWINM